MSASMPSSSARSPAIGPLWLDATYQGARGRRIVSVAAIAVAVNTEGSAIVGLHIGPSEAEVFWSDFGLSRGLTGVKL
jgi:transposase-like protein